MIFNIHVLHKLPLIKYEAEVRYENKMVSFLTVGIYIYIYLGESEQYLQIHNKKAGLLSRVQSHEKSVFPSFKLRF